MNHAEAFKNRWREYLIGVLVLSNIFVWVVVFQRQTDETLKVYFLDIGQGDAILIDSPMHGRALIDGGKNLQVLSELGKVLPFNDRRIDIVIATHPDADHIGGLPEVVSRYDVGLFIWSGVVTDKSVDVELRKRLEEKKIDTLVAERGMTVNFGDGSRLIILFPNQDVSRLDTNDASIVAKLIYGDESFLLTGDSPIKIENILLNLDKEILDSDVLKVGHHGSRTSTGISFTEAVSPEYAVISAGKNNSYGHPHQSVLDILEKAGAKIISTAESGTIIFETDGKVLKLK